MENDTPLPDRDSLARDVLAWYRGVGVDDAVGEEAIDWLARGNAAPGHGFRLDSSASAPDRAPSNREQSNPERSHREPPPAGQSEPRQRPQLDPMPQAGGPSASSSSASASTTGVGVRNFPTASPDEAVMAARAAAGDATTLADLRARLDGFNGCALKATAKNLCFYRGAERARLMLIGEAPGRDEDLSGKPFVGPAGQLLDRMLAAIGLTEADVHITNTVYWRPPGNRTPSPQETQACRPFLDRQIELVGPEMIALLGGAAANTVLGVPGGIMRLRGTWRQIEVAGRQLQVMPTLHPAFLLRSPGNKRQAWRDLLAIAEALDPSSAGVKS